MNPDRLAAVLGRLRQCGAVIAVLGIVAAVPTVPWLLVADVHGPVAWEPVDTDQPGGALMTEVTGQLGAVDHRQVSRVYLLKNGSRIRYATYEVARDYSNYQYLANLVRWGRPAGGASVFPGQFVVDVSIDTPVQIVQYADDTLVAFGYRAAVDAGALPTMPIGNYSVAWNGTAGVDYNTTKMVGPNRSLAALYRPYFSPRGGGWRVQFRNDSAVVVGIDDPEAVFSTVPMAARAVHKETRVRVVLDAETGRPERILEHRVVTGIVDGEPRRRHYVVVTTFSEWRTLDIDEPEWVEDGAGGVSGLIADLLYY